MRIVAAPTAVYCTGDVRMKRILSIRGGGIRGIIPCCALVKLEQQLGGLTRDHIDMVAGTSTGALLAAAVAAGIPAAELLKVYTERSKEVFTPTGIIGKAKQVARGWIYDPANLHKVLVSVFGKSANLTINECPIDVMIPATSMDGHNWFFVRDNRKNASTTGNWPLLDVATASASAPTYFAPWKIGTEEFFDGGAGGNANPVYQAAVEAFYYDDFVPAETRIVTLGTGFYPAPSKAPSGLLSTVAWVIDSLLDNGEDDADATVDRHWPEIRQGFNVQMPRDIDMADISAIPQLVQLGQQMAAGIDWTKTLSA